jgi:hypothetical protein
MSLDRFNVLLPFQFRGLEEYADKGNYDFALSLVSRLDTNIKSLVNAIRDQCITDKAILPAITGGESEADADVQIAVNTDVEGAQLETMLWLG